MSRGEFFGFALLAIVVGMLVLSSKRGGADGSQLVPKGTPLPPLDDRGVAECRRRKLGPC